jgi:phosphate/sulfate permease
MLCSRTSSSPTDGWNLTGALTGTAVASTIGKGIVDLQVVTMPTILCALIGAIIWNLITWMLGLPSSSSHALIGGLTAVSQINRLRQAQRMRGFFA